MIFDTIVIITASDENAKRDTLALKQFRPRRMLRFSSGSEAIDYLNTGKADIILLDAELGDMDGIKFLKLVRLNMNLKNTPVVMVTSDGRRHHVLDAIAAGCAGYILRPYSPDTFKRHVLRACQAERMTEIEELHVKEAREMVSLGNYDDAIEAFEEIVSEQNQAQKFYDLGCKYLMRQKFGQAIIAFKKAVKINDLYAEAYKGLAEAYKGRGDLDNYKTYAQKAAEVFAQFNRMEEVKDLFIEILKYDPDSPNPFNTLGVNLRRAGDLPGALHAYRQALELTPEDENIHFNMSKAYFFMGDESKAKARVTAALALNPDFTEARKLYLKIFGTAYPVPASAEPAKKSAGLTLDKDTG
ncbi:MAG: tetratricopeptide repeat protein [Desulfovibrionaceae bacterium]|nr:tetratricopeptide repeat protein [Desulfovibrionaceae bacterium]MBF0513049.1 tetratricopeptide repeat protein [Desulfovibrionaceae bacterium]